jgi:hypothetical protein
MCIRYSECVFVALIIQHAKACTVLYFRLCSVRLYHIVPHYLIKGTIFGKKIIIQKSVLIFCTTFFRIIAHSKKNSARNCLTCTVKYPFISVGTSIFLTDTRKNTQISNFMRIRPAGAELLHVD